MIITNSTKFNASEAKKMPLPGEFKEFNFFPDSDNFFSDAFTKAAQAAHQEKDALRLVGTFDDGVNLSKITLLPKPLWSDAKNREENRNTLIAFREHLIKEVGEKKFRRIDQEYNIQIEDKIYEGKPLLPEDVYKFNIGMNHLEIKDFHEFKRNVQQFLTKPNARLTHREERNLEKLAQKKGQTVKQFIEEKFPQTSFASTSISHTEFATWVEIASTPKSLLDESYAGNKIDKIVGSYYGSTSTTAEPKPWIEHHELGEISHAIINLEKSDRVQREKPEAKKKVIDRMYHEFLVKVIVKKHLMREENKIGGISTWQLGTILPSPYKVDGETVWYTASQGVDSGLGKLWYTLQPICEDESIVSSLPVIRIHRDTSPSIYYQSGGPTISRSFHPQLAPGRLYSDSSYEEDQEFFKKFSLPPTLAVLYAGKKLVQFDKQGKIAGQEEQLREFANNHLIPALKIADKALANDSSVLLEKISQEKMDLITQWVQAGYDQEKIYEGIKYYFKQENISPEEQAFVSFLREENPTQTILENLFNASDDHQELLTAIDKGLKLVAAINDYDDQEYFKMLMANQQAPKPLRILGNSLGGFDAQDDVVQQFAGENRIPIVPIHLYAHSAIRVEKRDNKLFTDYLKNNKEIFDELNRSRDDAKELIGFNFDYVTQDDDFASGLGANHTYLGYVDNQHEISHYSQFNLRVFTPNKETSSKELQLGLHFNRVEGAEENKDFTYKHYDQTNAGEYNKKTNNSHWERKRHVVALLVGGLWNKVLKMKRAIFGRRGLRQRRMGYYKIVVTKEGSGIRPSPEVHRKGESLNRRVRSFDFREEITPKYA